MKKRSQILTKAELEIYKWWKGFRPSIFSEQDHIGSPAINTCGRDSDFRLAKFAGKIARKLYNKNGKRK